MTRPAIYGRRGRPMPKGWPKLRRRILERDGHRCQIRGPRCTGRATEVDHIIPFSKGGSDAPANLQSVCRADHASKTGADAQSARPPRKREPEPHPGRVKP